MVTEETRDETAVESRPDRVLVGIGNPGKRYHDTPHNAGFAVLDLVAERHGLDWKACGQAQIAWLSKGGSDILLVKPQNHVNRTGEVLRVLAQSMGFTSDCCMLVHDDIQMQLGKVRTRLRGSDGGHKGVRSVLVAFQTSELGRVKVGVAPEGKGCAAEDYLISRLPPAAVERLHAACAVAADRLMELIAEPAWSDDDGQRDMKAEGRASGG